MADVAVSGIIKPRWFFFFNFLFLFLLSLFSATLKRISWSQDYTMVFKQYLFVVSKQRPGQKETEGYEQQRLSQSIGKWWLPMKSWTEGVSLSLPELYPYSHLTSRWPVTGLDLGLTHTVGCKQANKQNPISVVPHKHIPGPLWPWQHWPVSWFPNGLQRWYLPRTHLNTNLRAVNSRIHKHCSLDFSWVFGSQAGSSHGTGAYQTHFPSVCLDVSGLCSQAMRNPLDNWVFWQLKGEAEIWWSQMHSNYTARVVSAPEAERQKPYATCVSGQHPTGKDGDDGEELIKGCLQRYGRLSKPVWGEEVLWGW